MKRRKLNFLIVGAGDVARRLTTRVGLDDRARWLGVARSIESAQSLREAGILPVKGDLDRFASLSRAGAIGRSASAVLYLAPPPGEGVDDPRVRRWLACVASPPRVSAHVRLRIARERERRHRASATPRPTGRRSVYRLRNVYTSTTGVYGDCAGERIDETRRSQPVNARARRRMAAEWRLRAQNTRLFAILRAPGIYAAERLPVDRLRAGTPALAREEDVYTNHIHADDLARALWLAIFRAAPHRVINVVDDSETLMGDYFDQVAGALALNKPPRLPRMELIKRVSPMLYSFMSESRRIGNQRMKCELRLRLRYATPADLLRKMKPAAALQRSLL